VLQAAEAARTLEETDGLSVRVINRHTIKPIDAQAIMKAVTDTRRVITVEEHNTLSGLGSAVADVIAESGKGCAFRKLGLPDIYSEVGYPEDLYAHYKLDADGIVDTIREVMKIEFEEDEDWEDEV
jgi:transketolase